MQTGKYNNMFIQNIKSSIKRLFQNKLYTIINVGGLALSFAIAILILLYVHNELNVDKYHKNLDNLYRLVENKDNHAYTAATYGGYAINKYPEAKYVAQYYVEYDRIFQYGNNKSIKIENLAYADSSFLKMFSINIIESNTNKLLCTDQSIIISQKTAQKLFGDADPLGQTMRLENTHDYIVEGIFEDYPSNSSFKHDIIAYFPSVKFMMGFPDYDVTKHDYNNMFTTFIMLNENVNKNDLNERIKKDYSERFWEGTEFYLQEFSDIYFNNDINDDYVRHGNKQIALLFLSIALIIIIIAMINYINLSTSISAKRALSIGIYKTLGAHRKNLIMQFMIETISICMLALILGFILAELFIPVFNNMLQYNLQVKTFYAFPFNMISLLCVFIIAVIGGLYPAFYLTKLSPLQVIKGKFVAGKGIGLFKKGLMVFQFIVTIVLITGTIIVYLQLNYWQNMDLGINKEHILSLNLSAEVYENASVFSERVSKIPSVEDICFGTGAPGGFDGGTTFNMEDGREIQVRYVSTDANYMDFYGINIIEGEGFSKNNPETNAGKFILNETAAKYMALDNLFEKDFGGARCIGVVKDFIYRSQKDAIKPLLIQFDDKESNISIKISPLGIPETLKQIEGVWYSMTTNFPFEYKFVNDIFDAKYKNEERLTKLLGYFAIFSIFIACLGLFGLISFMAEQRTKEIGVRKANGANIRNIILLFSKEFIQLIVISGIIAIPLSYYVLSKWLQNFAYATKLSWWVFAVSVIIAIVVSSLSVFYRAYSAASQNPVDALRYE